MLIRSLFSKFYIKSENRINIVLLIGWTISVLVLSYHHEIWRDEMRALSIAINCESFFNLPVCLKNEGHPILWYLLLKLAYSIFPNTIVLKLVAILIGILSGWLFIFHFKIPNLLKRLYLFSSMMYWENTIMCRNYGISSLLIIMFSIVYERKMIVTALMLLALLVQTNVIGLIVSICLFFFVLYDCYYNEIKLSRSHITMGIIPFIASILLFYYLSKPSSISNVSNFQFVSLTALLLQLAKAMVPGNIMPKILEGQLVLSIVILLLLALYFFKNKFYIFLFYCAFVMIHFIDVNVYDIDARHLGVFLMFIIFLFHRLYNESKNTETEFYRKINWIEERIFYPLVFTILVIVNIAMCYNDYKSDISSSKEFAHYIHTHKIYRDAVIISEPDYNVESLPYYLDNPIYFPRENKFGKYSSFTKRNRDSISLNNIVQFRDIIQKVKPTRVLLIIKDFDTTNKDKVHNFHVYVPKKMSYTISDLRRMYKIKDFQSSTGDENYTLYEIL